MNQVSEAGTNPKVPAYVRNRAKILAEDKSMQSVLHHLRKSGMIAHGAAYSRLKSWMLREMHGSREDLRSPFFNLGKGKGGGS